MNEKIRILHVFGRLDRGGAETMIMNLYRNIDKSKIQFDFVKHTEDICEYDDEIFELGGKIYSIPKYTVSNHLSYKKNWLKLISNNPEYKIIHGHMRSTASIYLKIAKKYGLTTIAHSHSTASRGNKIEQLLKNILQYPLRYIADYLVACSDEAGKWLFGNKAIEKKNYKLIRNSIEVEKYKFDKDIRSEIRKSLSIENMFVIGHVGNLTYPKNHKFLIDVFYNISKSKENSILLLIGDGDLRKSLEDKVSRLGIKDKVIFAGVVPNVNDYLQAMDIFVFPSLFEGLPLAVIEAQATGLQSIVSSKIPKESFLTSFIYSIPLESSSEAWSKKILSNFQESNRTDGYKQMKISGYDIESNSIDIENYYKEIYSRE